jgi:hypothetical protein
MYSLDVKALKFNYFILIQQDTDFRLITVFLPGSVCGQYDAKN